MRAKDEIGRYGEQIAAQHLVDAGLEILDRNWRCSRGELDIVARERQTLVFCEVKTRTSEAFGPPQGAVDRHKAARLRRLALLWLSHQRDNGNTGNWPALRFDVVAVLCSQGGAPSVTHIRSAF